MAFYLDVPEFTKYHDENFTDLRSIEIVSEACIQNLKSIVLVIDEVLSKDVDYDLSDWWGLHERNMAYLKYAQGKFDNGMAHWAGPLYMVNMALEVYARKQGGPNVDGSR